MGRILFFITTTIISCIMIYKLNRILDEQPWNHMATRTVTITHKMIVPKDTPDLVLVYKTDWGMLGSVTISDPATYASTDIGSKLDVTRPELEWTGNREHADFKSKTIWWIIGFVTSMVVSLFGVMHALMLWDHRRYYRR